MIVRTFLHTRSLILIITTVGKVLSQFQLPNTLPQSGGVQILIPSQYGQYSESQPSMLSGYPTISNPYGTGNVPTWSNNYSPVISQLPPGSVGIGSYQPQISQAGLQSGFLSTVPQGYTYSPLLSSPPPQFSGLPQGYSYPYTAVMGTSNMVNSQNIPQAVQIMPGVPQMAGFGAAVSPSTGRTVRILVPVYAPIPPSFQESQTTNPNSLPGSPQPQTTTSTSSDPSQSTPSNPLSDPSQTTAINSASSVPPPSINPALTQSSNLSDPNTPSATAHSLTSPSNNASPSSTLTDNNSNASNSLSKINQLIQAAANESDQNDTKLLGNIMDVVKEAIDVEKLRRKQGGVVQGHDGSSDSASAITKSVNMLINKLVQDALASQ